MHSIFYPFSFLVVSIAGWMNQHQQQVIEYLIEENRVLREQMGTRRMRFSDQRRRLAAKAKKLGRKLLSEVATIVTVPVENLMRDGFSVDELRHSASESKYRGSAFLEVMPGRFEVLDPIIEGADPRRIGSAINNVPVSAGVTFVEMVQATDLRNRKDFADGLNGSGIRRVLLQRQM